MSSISIVSRETKETCVSVALDLSGSEAIVSTGIGFFDHMLTALAFHAGWGLTLEAKGDLHVDGHHTIEDTGIVLGQAFAEAVGDKTGIVRFGHAFVPMDEAVGFCAADISGRVFLKFDVPAKGNMLGGYDPCLTREFFRAFAANAGLTLHLRGEGENTHHIHEAVFKAVGRALRIAAAPSGSDIVPSTKGAL